MGRYKTQPDSQIACIVVVASAGGWQGIMEALLALAAGSVEARRPSPQAQTYPSNNSGTRHREPTQVSGGRRHRAGCWLRYPWLGAGPCSAAGSGPWDRERRLPAAALTGRPLLCSTGA